LQKKENPRKGEGEVNKYTMVRVNNSRSGLKKIHGGYIAAGLERHVLGKKRQSGGENSQGKEREKRGPNTKQGLCF